ncbi:MAG: MFS transporter [Treponema sp.]|jgi:predicted MFS family arabinose efflux permease/HEAT repeat protein|nr:MFS transporter [Treponema sp.]
MAAILSPYRLGKARDLYNLFNVFNSLSWQFLTGNIITLFALRLGASSTYIGTISALLYVAFFFLPMGKILITRFSMIRIYSLAWGCRSIGMIPLLFAPIVFARGYHETALFLTLFGATLFHIVRGIGMVANNPVLSHLSEGPDRGSYMTQVQIINSAVGMFAGFIIALLLGRDPPLILYAIIMAVGIGCGIFSGIIVSKIPGPERDESDNNKKISGIFRDAMIQPSIRLFFFILLLVALVSGVSRTFIVVYSRELFSQSDGMVSLYAVFGGLGYLIVGLLIKFLVDRIGAKPIFSVCVILGLLSMIPVLFFPESRGNNFTTVTLYLTFMFFMLNFGWLGAEGIMQTYYLGMVPTEQMVDMGILYYLGFGIAGAGGSLLGGMFLDAVTAISGSVLVSFRLLFAILIVISAAALFLMRKLIPLGALPFRGALEVMFSYRELKAISLLEKLNKSGDSGEEEAILGALQGSPSKLAISGLLTRVKSPRLPVRMESIRALDALKTFDEDVEKALMDDIIHNPYTTAYRSARALGNHGVFPAAALMRELAVSGDYMLAGEALVALAKLGDNAFRPQIEQIVVETQNPRLKIMGVEAIGIYGYSESLPLLLDILRGANPPPYLRDEVILSMANILNTQNKFYPVLVRHLADESKTLTLALDEAESAYEYYQSAHGRKRGKKDTIASRQAKSLQGAVSDYIRNSSGAGLNRWIMELPNDIVEGAVQMILSEAVLDDDLLNHNRLRLLIAHWSAKALRRWTDKLKEGY